MEYRVPKEGLPPFPPFKIKPVNNIYLAHACILDIIVVLEGSSHLFDCHCLCSCAVCAWGVWCKGLKGCEAVVD